MTTVGVLGAGQLGRMLALAGYPLGLRFRFLDPAADAPAGQVAELVTAAFESSSELLQWHGRSAHKPEAQAKDGAPPSLALQACSGTNILAGVIDRFLDGLDVLTYEFENVPVELARSLERHLPVYPPPRALEASQDRRHEKALFQELHLATAPFAIVETRAQLDLAVNSLGLPAVLKTCRFGYDGKGQRILRLHEEVERAWHDLSGAPLILEGFVAFHREVSQIGVRGRDGSMAFYPLVENHHTDGILRRTVAPAPGLTEELQTQAIDLTRRVLTALDYVGVLAIEFFQVGDTLIANEMAPRVHNSGHWTIEGAECSQFENHLRAILGLPLGSTNAIGCSAMVNLIGTFPDVSQMLSRPGVHVHLYGKSARPGRKLGHVTIRAPDEATLRARLAD